VLVALADLFVHSARTLDDASERGTTDMRFLSTLYRQHRETLAQLMECVPKDEPVDEFNASLEDLASQRFAALTLRECERSRPLGPTPGAVNSLGVGRQSLTAAVARD
jgi:hypothetical protein